MSTPDQELAQLRAENRRLRALAGEREQEAHDLRSENEELRAKLAALQGRIERMTRRLYGPSSERHHPDQQSVDLTFPPEVAGDAQVIADAADDGGIVAADAVTPAEAPEAAAVAAATNSQVSAAAAPDSASAPGTAPRRRHPGRHALPADAEIIIEERTVPENERLDAAGQPLPFLGYRDGDKWDYRPGTYLLRRIRRAIYGRPYSQPLDRIVAPLPACLVPRGKMTDAALIHTVVEKFADHLPLYRQEQRAARLGLHLSRATLVTQVAAVAAAVQPIAEAIGDQVRRASFIHLDDTPVKLLCPGHGRTITSRIWVYRSAQATAFRFSASREGRHPADFLGDYRGFIVADAYAGHNQLYGPERATFVCCWAHVRRNFTKILDHHPVPFALRMVEDIKRLYAIEDDLRPIDDDARLRGRQERTMPLLAGLHQRRVGAKARALPKSDLGTAIDYALARWPALVLYATHGFLPIDNNPAENALRPWAIGRKNWLFFGSEAGGERAAVLATLIENCRMQGLDPDAYLREVVATLHRGCTDYPSLTPHARAEAGADYQVLAR
jgi:transposase